MTRPSTSFGTPGGRVRRALGAAGFGAVALAVAAILVVAAVRSGESLTVEVVQDGLEHPWDLAFSDDGRMVVTERIGRVRVFASGQPNAALLHTATVPEVRAQLESGLMGIAVNGDDVFVCATRGDDPDDPAGWRVDVLRATLSADGSLSRFEPLRLAPARGAPRHQGCAIEIGPDRHLWIAIGDANLPAGENRAQDANVLNGKVVRLTLDGGVPTDAPYASGAYSIGHRNPQGIAFSPNGRLVEVEHGTDVNDEINLIEAGSNYGYPCMTGEADVGPIPDACQKDARLSPPAWASGSPTLATSGIAVLPDSGWGGWGGNLVVTTLKEEDLRRFALSSSGVVAERDVLLDGEYGRLRAAVIGPDGALYLSTANGTDDRILRVGASPGG